MMDFNKSPFLVIWESTRACDLACQHCRASADPEPGPDELNTEEAKNLIDQVKAIGTPIFIFSGGDCLKRKDLGELISYSKSCGLRTGAIPAVTPALTLDSLHMLKDAGLDQVAFSLDAGNAKDHDSFRQVEGVFERTLQCIDKANSLGMKVQLNSLINVHNENQMNGLFDLIEMFELVFLEIFFLVPTGRGEEVPLMSAEKFEDAFEKIYDFSQKVNFIIKVTEAPHYRRFCHQQSLLRESLKRHKHGIASKHMPDDFVKRGHAGAKIGRAPSGVNSGKGFTFISHNGDIMPSGFLPIAAGNVRRDSLTDIYRNSKLFTELRDINLLKGRCGRCAYRDLCGGSRARAYAATGDYLEEDPCCIYEPQDVEAVWSGA